MEYLGARKPFFRQFDGKSVMRGRVLNGLDCDIEKKYAILVTAQVLSIPIWGFHLFTPADSNRG